MSLLHDFFNRFSNTVLLGALAVSTLGVLLSGFIEKFPSAAIAFTVIFLLSGISMLAKNGYFTRSKYIRYINLCIAAWLIGALLRILHMPGANMLLLVSWVAVVIVYGAWFISKPIKKELDIAKMVWVIIFVIGRLLVLFHWPYGDEVTIISMVALLFLVAALFIKNPRLLKSEIN